MEANQDPIQRFQHHERVLLGRTQEKQQQNQPPQPMGLPAFPPLSFFEQMCQPRPQPSPQSENVRSSRNLQPQHDDLD